MYKKSKILFWVFCTLIIVSLLTTYYRYVVVRDYVIEAQADCDPMTEMCFIGICDPDAGDECSGDPEEDTTYYKIIHRNAKNIPLCDPSEEGCDALTCEVGEVECEILFCDPDTEEEVECSDPTTYAAIHPAEEEEEEEEDVEEDVESEGEEVLEEDEDGLDAPLTTD